MFFHGLFNVGIVINHKIRRKSYSTVATLKLCCTIVKKKVKSFIMVVILVRGTQ